MIKTAKDARSTMDLDATIKGANVNVEDIENLISAIVTAPIDDGVFLCVCSGMEYDYGSNPCMLSVL